MTKFALIIADLNSSDLGEIVSEHATEAAANRALDKLDDVRGAYVAHRKMDGEWERRLEARDRRERPYDPKPEMLARAGKTLFGDRWQSDLARAIDVGDRRVRQWISGDRSIPDGVWGDIANLLRQRADEAASLLKAIERVIK